MIFGLGKLFYVILLLINSIAVLSEERFLRRIGLSSNANTSYNNNNNAFYGSPPAQEITARSKLVSLISAIQTLLRIIDYLTLHNGKKTTLI
ncbi:Yos1p SCDLUD_000325 [Saccharomycodes ludwigii]|uniref:Yos1p n=1 Tax=Saccharomycodes ludwigii TaxID=36035 RepID=UPI001E85606B|nr:hypothetical protein SCDLUD_000325 [Saccharomycodes ludwigii]KAH3902737.1 hypothetical protein SCDLUD_000325 [Saccharomycodes ludwigii]